MDQLDNGSSLCREMDGNTMNETRNEIVKATRRTVLSAEESGAARATGGKCCTRDRHKRHAVKALLKRIIYNPTDAEVFDASGCDATKPNQTEGA